VEKLVQTHPSLRSGTYAAWLTLRRFVVEAKKQRLQFKNLSSLFPRKAALRERENDFNSLRTTGPFSPSTFGFFAINPHLTHISESHPHLSFPEKRTRKKA
jgi:hypothetical protein